MIYSANQISKRLISRPKIPRLAAGIAYERKLIAALETSRPRTIDLIHNPWFEYVDRKNGETKLCSPDFILLDREFDFIIIGEIKLTWTPMAIGKLNKLYCPVVAKALGLPTRPIVVCKNLIPGAPKPQTTLTFAFQSPEPLFQWRQGPIIW